ncbi:HAD family hydrolase [Nocardioides sp.]|uniref:HAD family hydrolase n=1 Tax=Nocardioides sp. TaxID=35761 RepID=UPI0035270FA8
MTEFSTRAWPAAVLWDMDGTLVDTEPYWIEAEHQLAADHGGTWSHDLALELVGKDLMDSGRFIVEHMGVPLEPAEIVEYLLDRVTERLGEEIPWRPGARELVSDLHDHGIPLALVTMSYLRFVEPVLAALPPDTFAEVVTGDAVSRGKPDPEPYLKAARGLGVHPSSCLAVEDSGTGARSAESAGCTVLVVPNHVAVPAGERRVFRESLVGLDAGSLPEPWHAG